MITINIANEYTKMPGGRHVGEGQFSGEDFRISMLTPAFQKAQEKKEDLLVNLDGGYGYATSFLEESFGGLARETLNPAVLKIKLISEEEPSLIAKIYQYMRDALKEQGVAV